MPKYLALDYGFKRTGIAVTDDMAIIASGLTTVHSSELLNFLDDYLQKHNISVIVIGKPKDLQNRDTNSSHEIEKLIKHLKKRFSAVRIIEMDERFTSRMAVKTMVSSGLKKKDRRNKALVDEISATIILQDFMKQLEYGTLKL